MSPRPPSNHASSIGRFEDPQPQRRQADRSDQEKHCLRSIQTAETGLINDEDLRKKGHKMSTKQGYTTRDVLGTTTSQADKRHQGWMQVWEERQESALK